MRPDTLQSLYKIFRKELKFYLKNSSGFISKIMVIFFSPSFQVNMLYRLSHYFYLKRHLKGVKITEWLEQIMFGCLIAGQAEIGENFKLIHPTGTVIGISKIGNNVKIWQNVCLGSHGRFGQPKAWPVVEDDVKIYASATVIGGVNIGKNAVIGAGSFVNRDVPENTTFITERIGCLIGLANEQK